MQTYIQMRPGSSSSLRPAEKEKQRRDRMKDLYSNLASLLSLQSYEKTSLLEFLDRATISLTLWKEKVERLKARKDELENELKCIELSSRHSSQVVRVVEMDLTLDVNLIILSDNKKIKPSKILRAIEQGGAKILSSSFSNVGDYIYYTIHAQAFQARIGFDVELIESRLLKLVH